jgi:hypothetical protein
MLVTLCAAILGGVSFTPDAAMTERQDTNQGANRLETADQLLTASGSTGTRTHTLSSSAVNGGHIIALKPAVAAAGPSASLLIASP